MPPPPRSCVACKNSKTKCDFDPRSGKKCTRCARIGLRCEQAVPIKQGRRTVGHVGASSVAAVGGHTIHSYIGGQPTCHISASQECAAALAAAAAHPPLMQHRAGGGGGAVGAIGAEVAVGAVCAEVADAPGGEIEQSIAFLRSFVLRPDGEGSPAPDSLVFMLRFNAAVARSRNSFDAMSGVLRACSALGVPLRHVLSMPAAGQGAAGPLELPGDAQAMLHCSAGYVHVRHLRDGTPHLRSNFAWESAILPMSETLASIESSASPCPLERALHPEDRPLALQLLVSIPLLAPGTEYSLQLPALEAEPALSHSNNRAREDTHSAVLGRTPLYSLCLCRSYSRAALKTLHDTVLPPRGWRTQHVGCRYRSGCMTAATTTTAPASSSPA
mmetsp:Transcript_34518/g.110264  ORF Transcript_34518/g.110264 Transcript_34518/m.110264 type:complete len:387 (-) Transcript_34518:1188-2348(-)